MNGSDCLPSGASSIRDSFNCCRSLSLLCIFVKIPRKCQQFAQRPCSAPIHFICVSPAISSDGAKLPFSDCFCKGLLDRSLYIKLFPSVSVFVEIYLLQSLDKYLSLIEKQYLQVLCAYKNLSLLDIIFLFSEQKYTALAYPKAHFCCFSILCRAAITSLNL